MTGGSIIWSCILLELLQGLCVMEMHSGNKFNKSTTVGSITWSCVLLDLLQGLWVMENALRK